MLVQTSEANTLELFQLLSNSILPRPIAWVGSVSADGIPNLAPYSFFNIASVTPPMVSISIMVKPSSVQKDTLVNIKATKVFSISVVSADLIKNMSMTSMELPPEVNEFEAANMTQEECDTIPCFRCGEAKLSLECKLREVLTYGEEGKSDSLIVADILAIKVDDSIMKGPQIDINKLDPIGHLIGPMYSTIRDKITPMS